MEYSDHGVAADLVLALDVLDGHDVFLEIRASRPVPSTGIRHSKRRNKAYTVANFDILQATLITDEEITYSFLGVGELLRIMKKKADGVPLKASRLQIRAVYPLLVFPLPRSS